MVARSQMLGESAMKTVETEVARHYTLRAIESRFDEALRTAGKDPERLGPDDL